MAIAVTLGWAVPRRSVWLLPEKERAKYALWIELGLDPVFERRKILGFPTFREAAAKVLATSKKS